MQSCTKLQELVNDADIDQTSMPEYTINECVVLAGQPQPEDWQRLRQRGFDLVINMRSDPERAAVQAKNAEAAGLRHLHLPLPTYELERPHIADFHNTLAQLNGDKVLIHCRSASRTALLWMLNRIVYEGWTQEEAEAELRAAGYDEDSMEVFTFCSQDYFERVGMAELQAPA